MNKKKLEYCGELGTFSYYLKKRENTYYIYRKNDSPAAIAIWKHIVSGLKEDAKFKFELTDWEEEFLHIHRARRDRRNYGDLKEQLEKNSCFEEPIEKGKDTFFSIFLEYENIENDPKKYLGMTSRYFTKNWIFQIFVEPSILDWLDDYNFYKVIEDKVNFEKVGVDKTQNLDRRSILKNYFSSYIDENVVKSLLVQENIKNVTKLEPKKHFPLSRGEAIRFKYELS
ncbi:hypothetical protein AKJ43_01900 [candidate division MSBL1 archaeon SCGC-AAA261D19]|uniref:Uncharacterized protein n=1 Tax=candidate division MSBL1 archaeon SCGC-AAA261D19 TaxID=1698273 RepID=A0A133V7D9_9EURY|nr:hypothetical protein AKJ43_01900 [candidate division MSBL1 archaeon SCGC-AAA261D19]